MKIFGIIFYECVKKTLQVFQTKKMEIAMQFISNDKIVGNNRVQDLKDFNSQSLSTPAKKREQIVSMMPAIRKAFDLMGEDIV